MITPLFRGYGSDNAERPVVESLEQRLYMAYAATIWTAVDVDRSRLGEATTKIVVQYAGAAAGEFLDKATMDYGDITVTEPTTGFAHNATFVEAEEVSVGGAIEYYVVYALTAPGGSWDPADGNLVNQYVYNIALNANEVMDGTGAFVAAAPALGTFDVVMDAWQVGEKGLRDGSTTYGGAVFDDPDGTRVTVRYRGPGYALISDGMELIVPFQTARTGGSTLTITTRRSRLPRDNRMFDLARITTASPLKALVAKTTNLGGNATLGIVENVGGVDFNRQGAIGKIALNDISNSAWDIPFWTDSVNMISLQAKHVTDSVIDSVHPFSRVCVTDWMETPFGVSGIAAPSIGKLMVKGDFEADLTLDAVAAVASLGNAKIGGWLRDSDIIAQGGITKLMVGGMDNSNVLAGVVAIGDMSTLAAGDFLAPSSIGKLSVKGLGGVDAFVDSSVAAWGIGKILVSNVDPTNLGTEFGVVAHTIASYNRTFLKTQVFKARNLVGGVPVVVDSLAPDYVCRLV